jgi:RNA polymerase sigma factor (sigma-70 family)
LEKIPHSVIENLGGWLYTIAKHSCIDLYRKRWVSLESVSGNQDTSLIVKDTHLQDQEKEIQLQQIRQKINQLVEKQRICLKLYLEGYSYEEIFQITHYTKKEVKSAIQAGKENIKKSFLQNRGD